MRHFLLHSIALSTLAVLAAAGKKLEELSPAAREFLKKRESFLDQIHAAVYAEIKKIPGGKEYFDYIRKFKDISLKNLNLPKNAQISYPKYPAGTGANVKTAYNNLYRQHAHKKDAFDHANVKAYNELFFGGYIFY